MRNKKIYLLMLLLMNAAFLQAQEKLSLTLEGAKQHAVQYNLMLKNSGLAVDQSQEKLKEVISSGLPQINAAADYSNALGAKISIRFNPDMPATEIPIKPSSNLSVNVGQLLFSGSYLVGLQTARLYTELTEKSYLKTEQEIMSQVTDGYYLVLISGEMLEILKQNVVNLEVVHKKTEAVVRVGMMERTDLDQLTVQLSTLKNAVNSSERQLEMAKNLLRLQLGATADTEIELTENLRDFMGKSGFESLVGSDFSVNQNIDYQLMEFQEKLSMKQVDLKKAAALPTLSGYYNFTQKLLKPDFDMSPRHMIGLKMNIPVFSSGMRNAQVSQAKIELETMRNNKQLLSEQLEIQEKQLHFNLNNSIETYLNQKNNVEVSRRVYNSLKLKFEQGLISGLDIVSADNNFLRAETDYLSSVFQVLQARVALDKLYGNLK